MLTNSARVVRTAQRHLSTRVAQYSSRVISPSRPMGATSSIYPTRSVSHRTVVSSPGMRRTMTTTSEPPKQPPSQQASQASAGSSDGQKPALDLNATFQSFPASRQTGSKGAPRATAGSEDITSFKPVWAMIALTAIGGLVYRYIQTQKVATATVMTYQVAGKLEIGGDFHNLVDSHGVVADSEEYRGMYPLIYFGFTHCPDICPTELNKMMEAMDIIQDTDPDVYRYIKPLFISVDPLRDTKERLATYASQFHPRIRWLTGKYEDVLDVSKKFRVYFSIPDDATPDSEYNVDHSIFFFLMDQKGELLNYYGQNKTAQQVAEAMSAIVREDIAKLASGNSSNDIVERPQSKLASQSSGQSALSKASGSVIKKDV